MKIYLGTDHAGYELKERVKEHLLENGHEVRDMGAHEIDPTDDYPDFIAPVAEAVSKDPENHRGIVFGHSGQGEAIVANRFSYIRTTVYYGGTKKIIELGREHNDSNILSLGASFVDEGGAIAMVDLWLKTPFPAEERHIRRIEKIDQPNSEGNT